MNPSRPPTRQILKALLFSGAGSLLLFLLVTWPLGTFWDQGIPSSAQNIEQPPWRNNIPGDHLQLLYHFDLVADMFSGRINWMTNPYEFNSGDDTDRFIPGSYFFPMSAVYALLKCIFGQATAWNSTLWISLWASCFLTWVWLRRFTTGTLPLVLGILICILPPVRWISLLGGSPAGIALMWIPLYALSVDLTIREPKTKYGFFLGFCLLLLFWADLQVFYFTVVTTPILALISFCASGKNLFKKWKSWFKCLPGIFVFGLCIVIFYIWRKQHLTGSAMEGGRGLEELALYSPLMRSFWIQGPGKEGMVYLGWGTLMALCIPCIGSWTVLRSRWKVDAVKTVSWFAFLCALLFCCFLAVGTNAPLEGAPVRIVRRVAPYFDMIRQPAKIMTVVPLWLGWMLTCLWSLPFTPFLNKIRKPLLLLSTVWIVWGFQDYVSTTISLMPPEQAAYAAVREDTEKMGIADPRLLVVPLWPGESAETSVPMHFAQKYHLRLLNGYSPVVSEAYLQDYVEVLDSVNMGWLTDSQISQLKQIGIHHLIVHENMFPEKVSPFPITETLLRLQNHPRLELLTQSGSVHAFKILEDPLKRESFRGFTAFPARIWRFNNETHKTAAYKMPPSNEYTALFRMKGEGTLDLQIRLDDKTHQKVSIPVTTEDWEWIRFPVEKFPHFGRVQFVLNPLNDLEVDHGLIVRGPWELPLADEGIRIPASAFFHAGYTGNDGDAVHMRRSDEPDTIIFYGPRLPLGKGEFHFQFHFTSSAQEGTPLGAIRVRTPGQDDSNWIPVIAGESAEFTLESESNRAVDFQFTFTREADMVIQNVEITPVF